MARFSGGANSRYRTFPRSALIRTRANQRNLKPDLGANFHHETSDTPEQRERIGTPRGRQELDVCFDHCEQPNPSFRDPWPVVDRNVIVV